MVGFVLTGHGHADVLGLLLGELRELDSQLVEVQGRDSNLRFLPAGAAEIRADEIRISSALVFLDERELSWYLERSVPSPTA